MKNTMKIKVTITTAKLALLYNDGTSKFQDEEIVGKFNSKSAEKYITSDEYSKDFENVKTCKVLDVETSAKEFKVDTLELYKYLSSNNLIENE